jgi:DNA polymerase IIIc chi subunit
MSDDFSAQDQLVLLRAEVDQMIGLQPEIARLARATFKAFRSEGFTDNQALYLTAVQLKGNPGVAPS